MIGEYILKDSLNKYYLKILKLHNVFIYSYIHSMLETACLLNTVAYAKLCYNQDHC